MKWVVFVFNSPGFTVDCVAYLISDSEHPSSRHANELLVAMNEERRNDNIRLGAIHIGCSSNPTTWSSRIVRFRSSFRIDGPSSTIIGNTFYAVGGSFRTSSRSFRMFDMSSHGDIIEEFGAEMKYRRRNPLVLSTKKGDILVLGELEDVDGTWGEAYSTRDGIWRSIDTPQDGRLLFDVASPGSHLHNSFFWAILSDGDDDDVIEDVMFGRFVESLNSVIFYKLSISDLMWDKFTISLPKLPDIYDSYGCGSAVAVGRVLLWFAEDAKILVAYDLERGDWFHEKQTGIIDPEVYDFRCVKPKLALVREGKKGYPSIVTLLWAEPRIRAVDGKSTSLVLHCMRIAVDLEPEKRLIQTYLMSCEAAIAVGSYNVNHYLLGDSVSHCSQGDVLGSCDVHRMTLSRKRSFTSFSDVSPLPQIDDKEVRHSHQDCSSLSSDTTLKFWP
ncbi:hypothetical protein Droror1_Dr00014429 [Drosera rotundifolia]